MEKLIKKIINFYSFKIISDKIRNNIKSIIYSAVALVLIIIVYQFYIYQNNKKILKLSILYDQAKSNTDSVEFNQIMNTIVKEKGFYGMLASLELIKDKLSNKDYNAAYMDYFNLLNQNNTNNVYLSVIALHGSYNLLDKVSSDKIVVLLSYIDKNIESFIGYRYEILFLISINNNNYQETNELYKQILEHEKISPTIKNRVRKINDFEKYK